MINSVKSRAPILASILFVFGIGNAFADNKVVVIPMASDLPNVYTNSATGFVGIGTDTPFNQYTLFSVKLPTTNTWGGMYMSTSGSDGRPFYGYTADGINSSAWHEYNGAADEWQLYMGGGDPVVSVDTNGDIAQRLTSDGLVKSAVFANCSNVSATIDRSFNNVNDAAISISSVSNGSCTIDFGFDISNRFWSPTGVYAASARNVVCKESSSSNNELDCLRTTSAGAPVNGDIIVLIY